MHFYEGEPPPEPAAITQAALAERLRALLRMLGRALRDGRPIVRGYMITDGPATLGASLSRLGGLHNSQLLPPGAARATAGAWSRLVHARGTDEVRYEGGADVALVVPGPGEQIDARITRARSWVRPHGGTVFAVMPLSRWLEQDPRAILPLPDAVNPVRVRAHGYRTAGLCAQRGEPGWDGPSVILRLMHGVPVGEVAMILDRAVMLAARRAADGPPPDVASLGGMVLAALPDAPEVRPGERRHLENRRVWRRDATRVVRELPALQQYAAERAQRPDEQPALLRLAQHMPDVREQSEWVTAADAWLSAVHMLDAMHRAPELAMPYFGKERERVRESAGRSTRGPGAVALYGPRSVEGALTEYVGAAARAAAVQTPADPEVRDRSFFAAALPDARVAGAAALGAGLLRQAGIVEAMQVGERTLVHALESPRLPQLTQLMTVLPAALPAHWEDRDVMVAFHTVRTVRREAEMREEGATVDVIDAETLNTQASLLDLDTGAVSHVAGEALRELQVALAPQLLEELQRVIEVELPTSDVERTWRDFQDRQPSDLAALQPGREPWGEQRRAIATGAAALDRHGAWLLAGEQGSGKTTVLTMASWLSGFRRTVVVCPAAVMAEWDEQVREILPGARLLRVRKPAELAAVPEPEPGHPQFVLIPDSMLSGGSPRRRAAMMRLLRRVRVGEPTTLVRRAACPHCGRVILDRARGDRRWLGTRPASRGQAARARCRDCDEPLWQELGSGKPQQTVPVCSGCGWHRLDRDGKALAKRALVSGTCDACGAEMSAPGATSSRVVDRRMWSLARAWKRVGFHADLLILDEMHRLKGGDSARGLEAAQLIGLADRTALATATVTDGRASSLYHILRRLVPGVRRRFPSELAFASAFGISETRYRVHVAARNELRRTGLEVRQMPGLHPMLLPELLPWTSFLTQQEVVGEEVRWDEYLVLSPLPEEPAVWATPDGHPEAWGRFMRDVFAPARTKALARAERAGDGPVPAVGASWRLLEDYLEGRIDRPQRAGLRLDEVVLNADSPAGKYAQLAGLVRRTERVETRRGAGVPGVRFFPDVWSWRGEVVTSQAGWPVAVVPPAVNTLSPKEQDLLGVVRAESAAGRRCLVYVEGTDVRDVAGRVVSVLAAAGLRAVAVRSGAQSPAARKEWITGQVEGGLDALVSHPNAVGTGLNLQAFPTIVVYEINHSSYTMRQAVMRSARVDQDMPVRHVYLVTPNTTQEGELLRDASAALSAAPAEARQATPGRFMTLLGRSAVPAQMTGFQIEAVLQGYEGNADLRQRLQAGADRVRCVAQDHAYVAPPPLPVLSVVVDEDEHVEEEIPQPGSAARERGRPDGEKTLPPTGAQLSFFGLLAVMEGGGGGAGRAWPEEMRTGARRSRTARRA